MYDRRERLEKLLDSLTPWIAGLGCGLLVGMPFWMILLGWI